jgi:subtilisin family serine protease
MPFGIGQAPAAGCDPVLQAAVAYALRHNAVLVASAGNASRHAGPGEPASCAGVLAVGGIEPDGSLWPGSTRSRYVAVAAPADHMVYVGRDGRYTMTGAGTSFAAALTAGAAALIRSRYPDMPWYKVDQRLTATATPAGRQVPNTGYGYGIVNLARAVNAAAYPVRASDPNPVYARFRAWLATHAAPGPTLQELVITAAAAVCAFVAALVTVLRMSARRRVRRDWRHAAPAAQPHPGRLGRWEEKSWSFGPDEEQGYGGTPGYGRPPPWTDSPHDWR